MDWNDLNDTDCQELARVNMNMHKDVHNCEVERLCAVFGFNDVNEHAAHKHLIFK